MLKVEHLQKRYKQFSLNCSLEIKSGYVTGLIGQNGAGKSTTFKAILGLISIDGGAITLLGKEIENFTAKDKEALGVVLSDSGFSGYLTIRDIVSVLEHLYHKFDKYFFLEQVKKYNLPPTAGLDVIARDELLELLREFMEKDEDRAILISSHISSDLETLCDDLYMIHDGKIILHEDTDVLLGDYALLKLDDTQYHALDKQYLLRSKKEPFGYSCLTDQKQYYIENYPDITIEKGTIDAVITMMIRGE